MRTIRTFSRRLGHVGNALRVFRKQVALDPDESRDQLERVRDQGTVDGRALTGDVVGDLDDHLAAVLGVAYPPDEAGRLEPVEDARDGARREADRLRQLTGG